MAQILTISGGFTNGTGQTSTPNIPITIATPICSAPGVALSSGFQNIAVPTGTTVMIIQLPANNTQTVTLKGVTGDTGLLLNKTGTNLLMLDSSVTQIGLTCGGAITALTFFTFL